MEAAGKLTSSGAKDQSPEDDLSQVQRFEHSAYASPACLSGFRLTGSLNGIAVSMLVDTGSAATLLRLDVWEQIVTRNPLPLTPCPSLRLLGAGGEPLTVHGRSQITLGLGSNTFVVDAVVVNPLTSQAILGLDFLVEQRATIDLPNRTLRLGERGCNIPLEYPSSSSGLATTLPVCSTATVDVPPRSSMIITGSVAGTHEGLWLLEEAPRKQLPVAVARGLVELSSVELPVVVLNTSEETVTVYKNMEVATLQEVDKPATYEVGAVDERQATAVEEDKQQVLWDLVENSSADLSPGEKELFYNLLLSYADVIAYSTSGLGKTNVLKHHIPTGDAAPIRQSVRRISPHQRQDVQNMLTQMLEGGVVEPSASPWASPIVLVRKKDGSTRFCVDYRKLNDVTRKDAYPLPRIDATLDALHGSRWFSALDLLSGYWQVEVAEMDRPKTAFCTTEGLYQFRVMPFGLCNAPATFQRLMDLVLAGLQWRECLVYLDDVIVLGHTFQEHLCNLRSVLQRLRESGLRLKPSKCSFFQSEVQYLGYIISRKGVSTDPKKTQKVSSWPLPTTKREVQQFLGFAGYYRRFVRDFASIARPLHRLTEHTSPFVWTNDCQIAFEELRHRLCSAPILAFPDFSREFILDTDASDVGIGAVLSQVDEEGHERVIAYGSRALTKPERRYCVTRRELLAVVQFTRQYRPYLMGRKFILRTDHGSLTWLRNFRDPEGQIARWLERLEELDFDIVHRRGKAHTNADALSRLPCQQCGRESHVTPTDAVVSATAILQSVPNAIGDSIRDVQLADPILGPLLRGKEMGEKPNSTQLGNPSPSSRRLLQLWEQLVVADKVLCRQFESRQGHTSNLQVVVPSKLRKEVLAELHEGAAGGHFGVDKTLARLKERFYWPGHFNDVKDWCSNCGSCASRKAPSPKSRKAPLTSIVAGYPMQLVAMDVVGPFPESPSGNKYVLVAADYFTRWVEAYPIPNQEATTVARKLVDEFFCRFSPPERLHSDQGRNFESAVIAETCKLLGINKSRTTPYHPQSDGLVERFNRTLLDMLSKSVGDYPSQWEHHIRRLCLAYNTSVNPTTGHTPFFLMFGRQVRMPVDIMYGTPGVSSAPVPKYVAELRDSLTSAYQQVRTTTAAKLKRQKEFYDRKVHGQPFDKGDLVWLNSPAVPKGKPKKLHCPWTGPFKVVGRLSEAVYRIQHTRNRRKRRVVHFDRLKPCSPDTRLPLPALREYSANPRPAQRPPVGAGLELLEDDTDTPLQPGDGTALPPVNRDSIIPPVKAAGAPLPLPPPLLPPPAPRYPRRNRAPPDRYRPGIPC